MRNTSHLCRAINGYNLRCTVIAVEVKMLQLRGREDELRQIVDAWQGVVAGQTRYVRIAGEPGVGKTRLMQETYRVLAVQYDTPQQGFSHGYWPELPHLGQTHDMLSTVPPVTGEKRPPLPYFWWALRCRQGNESQNGSFQPYTDGKDQFYAHLLPQINASQVKAAWVEVAHSLVFGSFEYVPVVGPLLKSVYTPVRNLNARLRKLREPLQPDDSLFSGGAGSVAAGSLEESLVQLIAALNDPHAKRIPNVPACIVLDDAQWADSRSIAFTQRLLELGLEQGWRLLVVAMARSNELDGQLERARSTGRDCAANAGELELGLIRRAGGQCALRLELKPELGEDAIRQIIQDQLPQAAPATIDALVQRAGGHPYFAVNYARLVEESGWLDSAGGLTVGAEALTELPAEISAVIDRRLNLLDTTHRRILNWGSVQGARFVDTYIQCAAAKLGLAQGEALVALDSLQCAHRLVGQLPPPPTAERLYQFSHALVYERLRQKFGAGLQEHRLVRAALGEMLRGHVEQGALEDWPVAERCAALQFLFDYAAQRARAALEPDPAGWSAAWLTAAARLLALRCQREEFVRAEPVADEAWSEIKSRPAGVGAPGNAPHGLQQELLPVLCSVFSYRGKWDDWQQCAELWLAHSRQAEDLASQAGALLSLAELHSARGSFETALQFYEQVAQIAHSLGDRAGEAETLAGMAETYLDRANYDEAYRLFEECRQIRLALGDEHGVLEAQQGLADVHCARVEIKLALPLYEIVLAGFRQFEDERGAARVLRSIGELYLQQDDSELAAELLGQSLEIQQRLGDEHGASETSRKLSVALTQGKQFEQAHALARKSLEVAQRLGDLYGQARCLASIAWIHFEQDYWQEALPWLQQSMELFEKVGNQHQASKIRNNIANVYFHHNDYEQALELLQQAAASFLQLGAATDGGYALATVGWILLCLARYSESIEASGKSLQLNAVGSTYFNISLAKWLRGDADAVEHYQAGISRYAHGPDTSDFSEAQQRGLATEAQVRQLEKALGVALITPILTQP